MKLLLDTHIWLWSLSEPALLTPRVKDELTDAENELWLSPVSVWEVLMLSRKGRITLDGPPGAWIREALEKSGLREATLTHEVAVRSMDLRFPHWDPADRFIAASAVVYDLTLVTADERLLRSHECTILANA
jgi:PIN domain nuclease of toxin-antitoxin system